MKHRAFTLLEVIIIVLILAVIAALLFPVFARSRTTDRSHLSCILNLKQLGLGFLQYTQDYDDKFPPVSNANGGWTDLVFPYLRSAQIFHCPTVRGSNAPKQTDYFFNARLSSFNAAKSPDATKTILGGDGLPAQGPAYSLSFLPPAWRTDENSPAWRHFDAANYLFADGHVKQLKPAQITLDAPGKNTFTFRAK